MTDNPESRDGKKTVLGTGSAGRVTDRRKLFRRLVALAGLGITGVLLSQDKAGLLPVAQATSGGTSGTALIIDGSPANSGSGTTELDSSFLGNAFKVKNTSGSTATGANGIWGETNGTLSTAVYGNATASGVTAVNYGVVGQTASQSGTGVLGNSTFGVGVQGITSGAPVASFPLTAGVFGSAVSGIGVLGLSAGASAIPIVAAASLSQMANLQEWQNGSGFALSVVDKNGNFGIGTSAPAYPLDIASSSLVPFRVSASAAWPGFLMVGGTSASGMNGMEIQNSTGQQFNLGIGGHTNSAVPDTFFIYDNNSSRFAVTVTPTDHVGIGTQTPTHLLQLGGGAYCDGSGAWIAGSSVRWKENITPLMNGVETLKQLHPVSYNRKETPGKTTMGFIAEEVGKVLPTVVDWDPKEEGYAEGYDHLAILALAVEAVKEQQRTIEQLRGQHETEIEQLRTENNILHEQLTERIEVLERKLTAS